MKLFQYALITVLLLSGCQQAAEEPLVCHVGGTMRPVMEELAKRYQEQTGQAIEINSAGSGELLAHIDRLKEGDLYVCHDPFIDILMQKYRLGVDGWLLAELTPVIVVQQGNPKNIQGLADLTREDVSLILTDYKRSSLGRMLPTIFSKAGIDFDKLNEDKEIVTNKSGSYAANVVSLGNADAGMVWNAVAKLREDKLDSIAITGQLPVPGVDTISSASGKAYYLTPMRVTAATLKTSRQPAAAAKFLEYIASEEAVFAEFGFTMSGKQLLYKDGQAQTATVGKQAESLTIFAGAGLRKALEQLIEAFKAETGILVEPDYGGSGIIMARARESKSADLFMPGDVWYVDRLHAMAGSVTSRTPVSYFVPVIITQKGNPKGIRGLEDLKRADLSVAFGKAKACQIGRLITQILEQNGIERAAIDAKESLTVNELGVWVQMKDVDAAIVWDAIAANLRDHVEIIDIPREQNIISQVVVATLNTSANPEAAARFAEFAAGEKGREILRKFDYRVDAPYAQ